jgi:hypothetical protein
VVNSGLLLGNGDYTRGEAGRIDPPPIAAARMTNPVRSPGADSLAPRFARGGLYLMAGHGLGFALNFAINLAIARTLGPDGFTPYALAFAWNELLVILGAFSLNLALVQFREESQALYDTALAICAGIGLVGMLASFAIAGLAAQPRSAAPCRRRGSSSSWAARAS